MLEKDEDIIRTKRLSKISISLLSDNCNDLFGTSRGIRSNVDIRSHTLAQMRHDAHRFRLLHGAGLDPLRRLFVVGNERWNLSRGFEQHRGLRPRTLVHPL